jgi:hypothetical protein
VVRFRSILIVGRAGTVIEVAVAGGCGTDVVAVAVVGVDVRAGCACADVRAVLVFVLRTAVNAITTITKPTTAIRMFRVCICQRRYGCARPIRSRSALSSR